MDSTLVRHRIAGSRLARVAAFPVRAGFVARYDARLLGRSARWLLTSREHTNLTYELSELNVEHLTWFVAGVAGITPERARGYICELQQDEELAGHVRDATAASPRRGIADPTARFGRRLGWYALVRALRPERVVETGTDKGLGSCVLAAALLRNGSGRLTTMDVNPHSGYLIRGRYERVVDRRIGDSVPLLARDEGPVDVFLHDSLHTPEHEWAEFEAVAPRLTHGALVLSDNAHASPALPRWAEHTGRRFAYFQEVPQRHWWPGDGIGAAYRP